MRRLLFVLVFCFLINCNTLNSFAKAETNNTDDIDDLVIAIYMTGSDLESNGGAASEDLREMMYNFPQNNKIRLLVMVSGSNKWELNISTSETSIYEITSNELLCVQKGDLQSMGAPETLSGFLLFVVDHYPASQYGLIIWDHGAGPLEGVCFDELFKTNGSTDRLTLEELDSALLNSPFSTNKLSFIGFDACLMCTLEVAKTVAPYAHYMIASQEIEPPDGWNYKFLKNLSGNERGDQIGEEIIRFYSESANNTLRPLTLSCLDLSMTDEVCVALGTFFAHLDAKITNETYHQYTRCRSAAKTLGNTTTSEYDLVDLIDLISLYERNNLADPHELTNALKSMVVCHFSSNVKYVNGISIYYPFDNKSLYESSWSISYGRLSFVPEYQSFIRNISNIYIGEALTDWKSKYQLQLQQDWGTVKLSVDLSPEEMNSLSSYRLIVVEERQNGVFQHIFVDYNNLRLLNNKIVSTYHGEALYLINEKGAILAGPITYYPVDEGIAVDGILYYDLDFDLPFGSQKLMDAVKLIYHLSDDGHLVFTDVMVIEDEKEDDDKLLLPSAIDFSNCVELLLYNAGPLSDVTSLEHVVHFDSPISINTSNGAPLLAFLPVYGMNTRYAYIRLTDTQGKTTVSEEVEIPNPTLIPISSKKYSLNNEQFDITLKSAELVSGYGYGVKCVYTLNNHSQNSIRPSIQNVRINEHDIGHYIWYASTIDSHEENEIVIYINGPEIQQTGIEEAYSLGISLRIECDNSQPEDDYSIVIPIQLNTAVFSKNPE